MAYPCHPADHPDCQKDFTGTYPDTNTLAAARAPAADRRSSDADMEIDTFGFGYTLLSNPSARAAGMENDAK